MYGATILSFLIIRALGKKLEDKYSAIFLSFVPRIACGESFGRSEKLK